MRLTLALLLSLAAVPARADALRDAALTAMLVRENPGDAARRAALGAAFDAADGRTDADLPVAQDGPPRRNWFHRRPGALPAEPGRIAVPHLPRVGAPAGFVARAGAALAAAFAPWRALADAAWGGSWAGSVAVGVAEHRR